MQRYLFSSLEANPRHSVPPSCLAYVEALQSEMTKQALEAEAEQEPVEGLQGSLVANLKMARQEQEVGVPASNSQYQGKPIHLS